jgi:hypothetical protein
VSLRSPEHGFAPVFVSEARARLGNGERTQHAILALLSSTLLTKLSFVIAFARQFVAEIGLCDFKQATRLVRHLILLPISRHRCGLIGSFCAALNDRNSDRVHGSVQRGPLVQRESPSAFATVG